jgi:hypothetical protein
MHHTGGGKWARDVLVTAADDNPHDDVPATAEAA